MLIASVAVYNGAAFTAIDTALRIQAAMLVAGIGTLIQRYPVWRIGSRLPVVMGLSFTFLSAMMTLAAKDYGLMIGAVIVGGCVEGLLGLERKILAALCQPDCLGMCRDDHRLQSAFDRHLVVCKLVGLSHRRVAEPSGRGDYACGVPCVSTRWRRASGSSFTCCSVLIVGYVVSLFFGMVDFASMKSNRAGAGRHCPSQAFCLHAEV